MAIRLRQMTTAFEQALLADPGYLFFYVCEL